MNRMGGPEWALLLVLSVLWGGSFFFVGIAVRELPPLTIVALRVGGAALALFLVLRVLGQGLPGDHRVWAAFLGIGMINNAIPFTLFVWGQREIASGLASILNATTPLFAVVLAHLITPDEKLTRPRAVGVVLGFAGVVLMLGGEALAGLSASVLAQLACLAAAFAYALGGIFGRRFQRLGVTPIVTAFGQVTASAILLVPLALAFETPWRLPLPGAATWSALAGLAMLSTALAYIIYFRVLARAGATNLLLVTFLIPVSAILLGVAFLGEALLAKHLAGMTLIGAGLAVIDGRPLAWFASRRLGWQTRTDR